MLGPGTPGSARVTARYADACHYLNDVEPARAASVEVLAAAERSGGRVALAAASNARQLVCSDEWRGVGSGRWPLRERRRVRGRVAG